MCEVFEESKRVFWGCGIVRKGESEVREPAGGTHCGRPCRPWEDLGFYSKSGGKSLRIFNPLNTAWRIE